MKQRHLLSFIRYCFDFQSILNQQKVETKNQNWKKRTKKKNKLTTNRFNLLFDYCIWFVWNETQQDIWTTKTNQIFIFFAMYFQFDLESIETLGCFIFVFKNREYISPQKHWHFDFSGHPLDDDDNQKEKQVYWKNKKKFKQWT